MKKLFFLLTMLALAHFANAQDVTIDSLANRVEVLEQQLAYERSQGTYASEPLLQQEILFAL